MEKAKVYFSKEITPEKVTELYKMLGADLGGKTAVKLHSGEKGNQNYLKPLFWKPIIEEVNGTVVECNTAYDGERNSTEKHKRLIMSGTNTLQLTLWTPRAQIWSLIYLTARF